MRGSLIFLLASVSALTLRTRAQTYTREVSFPPTPRPNDFRVLSVWRGPRGGGNALIVDLSTYMVPRFVLRFYNSVAASVQVHAARWSLFKLVEYTDIDAQEGFQADKDTINANYSLLDPGLLTRTWSPWVKTTGADGVHSVCSSNTPSALYPNFAVQICGKFCPKQTVQNRTGPGAGCGGRLNRSCKPGGVKWSMRIDNFPWMTNTSGIALKVVFDTRNVIREIRRNGTMVPDETSPDPDEPIVPNPTEEDDNDSVNDLGDDNTAAWERLVDVGNGTNCPACATARVIREVYKTGEYSRDTEGILNKFSAVAGAEALGVASGTWRVSYLSILPPGPCRPSVLLWDPEFINANANAALGLLPSLGLLAGLLALFM